MIVLGKTTYNTPYLVDSFFRHHHMVKSEEEKREIDIFCDAHEFLPCFAEVNGPSFKWVWWGYLDIKNKLQIESAGWKGYCHRLNTLDTSTSNGEDNLERKIEMDLAAKLQKAGFSPKRQVKLNGGVADIVTEAELYEVKAILTRNAVLKAIGQLLVYSQELPGRKLIIVGRQGDGLSLACQAQKLNIELRAYQ